MVDPHAYRQDKNEKMKIVLLLSAFSFVYVNAGVDRPRGVARSMASHYQPNSDKTFRCLDGAQTIPFRYVNDEYCDCKDGSDEPGTSACPNGKFMCTNAGYKPQAIPSSRVNDGVCDCCDGTDEYLDLIQCEDTCKDLGRKYREEQQKQRELQQEGYKKRQEFSTEGKRVKEEKKTKLESLKSEKEAAENIRKDLEMKKDEAEIPEKDAKDKHQKIVDEEKARREAEAEAQKSKHAFAHLDTNEDGQVDVTEMATHSEFDIDSNGEVSVEEAKEYLEETEIVDAETFTTRVWPNIKQIFKKIESEAKSDNQPPETGDAAMGEEADPPGDAEDTYPPPEDVDEGVEEDDEGMDDDDGDDDEEKQLSPPVTPPTTDTQLTTPSPTRKDETERAVDEKLAEIRRENERKAEEEKLDPLPEYDEETRQLIQVADEARRLFNEADTKVRDMDSEIASLEAYLNIDFGPEEEFAVMKDKCYEYTDREYTYKLCPFDRASQRSKHGGAETSLGYWGKWSGPNENKFKSQHYEKGQNCWNGPDRSVKVHFSCGQDFQITSAYEPSRCEYAFDFSTPVSCTAPPEGQQQDIHDEL